MDDVIYIEGGTALHGEVTVSGAKNVALKVIAAALLTTEDVVIHRMPRISDVDAMLRAISYLGAEVAWEDAHTVKINAGKMTKTEIPKELVSNLRASVVFWGPLLARFKEARIPYPGGDKIGKRPIDRFLMSMGKLGVHISCKDTLCVGEARSLHGAKVVFDRPTVTATENLIMLASLALGQTTILGASLEPEVDDLIQMLQKMGADIKRTDEGVMVKGVDHLGGTEYTIMGDRIEAATFAIAAVITGGDVTIHQIDAKHMTAFLGKLQAMGVQYKVNGDQLRVWKSTEGDELKAVDVETRPYPGFMTDWHPPLAVLLTQTNGVSTIHETVHSQRFGYVESLQKMGAEIQYFQPDNFDLLQYGFDPALEKDDALHAVRIFGPTKLRGSALEMPDLRAGATFSLAALIAEGETTITGVHHLDRGYESYVDRLLALGAKIRRVKGS